MSHMLAPMLGAMVICRGIARFTGYPPSLDPTFTNAPLLHAFSAALDARAQHHTLWHLTPADVATIFTPLLDYAAAAAASSPPPPPPSPAPRFLSPHPHPHPHPQLNTLTPADIATMQTQLTFAAAHALATDLDTLTRAPAPSWARWFALVVHARVRSRPDARQEIASANFFASCLALTPPPLALSPSTTFPLSLSLSLSASPPPSPSPSLSPPPPTTSPHTTTAAAAAADPFLSPHWTIASELRGHRALSPRMARLLAGSTAESVNTNWLNCGRYESAPLKG